MIIYEDRIWVWNILNTNENIFVRRWHITQQEKKNHNFNWWVPINQYKIDDKHETKFGIFPPCSTVKETP